MYLCVFYQVVVGYTFGETETYWNLPGLHSFKKFLAKWQIPFMCFHGPWWCPLLPYNSGGIHSIFGKGKQFPLIQKPTSQDIDFYHKWYCHELKRVFDTHKWRFGMENQQITIL